MLRDIQQLNFWSRVMSHFVSPPHRTPLEQFHEEQALTVVEAIGGVLHAGAAQFSKKKDICLYLTTAGNTWSIGQLTKNSTHNRPKIGYGQILSILTL